MKTIEAKVADAMLQRSNVIELDGRKITITAPTPATLILVSEAIAELPQLNAENIIADVLTKAKDCKALGKALAIMLLGAKRIRQGKKVRKGFFKRVTELEWLTDYLLEELSVQQLSELVGERLTQMQIGDFFALTASLLGTNITKATKEAETAFGE